MKVPLAPRYFDVEDVYDEGADDVFVPESPESGVSSSDANNVEIAETPSGSGSDRSSIFDADDVVPESSEKSSENDSEVEYERISETSSDDEIIIPESGVSDSSSENDESLSHSISPLPEDCVPATPSESIEENSDDEIIPETEESESSGQIIESEIYEIAEHIVAETQIDPLFIPETPGHDEMVQSQHRDEITVNRDPNDAGIQNDTFNQLTDLATNFDHMSETDTSSSEQVIDDGRPIENDEVIPETPSESDEENQSIGGEPPAIIDALPQSPIFADAQYADELLEISNDRPTAVASRSHFDEPTAPTISAIVLEQIIRSELNSNAVIPEADVILSPTTIDALANQDTEEIAQENVDMMPERDVTTHDNDEVNSSDSEPSLEDDETICHIRTNPIEISAQSRTIINRIERFVQHAVDDLKNGSKVQIVVQSRRSWDNCFIENERFVLLPIADAHCRNIKSTFSVALIFYLLAEIHELLLTSRRCTIRELYYKDVNVTQKQENVAEALKSICCLLDATPWELGVLSTSKGLIAGPLKIHLPDNSVVDCSIDKNGITLPHLTAGIVNLTTTATYVLVVEKDTVFKSLLESNILERWNHKCILMTGKGYPDTNTRLILNKLYELHKLPIYVITDGDPYGIEIMLTYRHGSLSMSNLSATLAVPSVRWLGIFPSDIRKFGIRGISLTEDDKRKLDNILNRPFINDHVHRELLILKQTNLKAEIEEISYSSCTYLIDVYLRNKIDSNNGI